MSKEVSRTAILQLGWRALDTTTGQILASGTVSKSGSQSNRSLAQRAGYQSSQQSEVLATELLVKSVLDAAMADLTRESDGTLSKEPFRAKVVQVEGRSVVLNAGSNLGVTAGDTFGVLDPETALTDPVTGEMLTAPGEPVGMIVVDRVAEKVSFATVVQQVDALRRGGDLVWLGRPSRD